MRTLLRTLLILGLLVLIASCGSPEAQTWQQTASASSNVKVVATTTIVGDVVHNVAGDAIDLTVLLPIGADPHSFQPTPQDVAKVSEADVVFMNGAGLEEFMQTLIQNTNQKARLVSVSDGITLRDAPPGENLEHPGGDPHTWMDPTNVAVWVKNIQKTLSELDPANASTYQANGEKYQQSLTELDQWIRQQVDQIPEANRVLVTDHLSFGYYAARYGFKQVGAIIPGFSTLAEPSAQELASLEDSIRSLGVKAIFVGKTINPSLAERIAGDTHTKLVTIYDGSLSEPGGSAATYLDYMHFDTQAFLEALK